MNKSLCPLCSRRRARRSCPALGKQICAVCCGTKRMTEIKCPSECTYLQSASEHPPAVVQRQQERDLQFLFSLLKGLTERQHKILFLLQSFLRSDQLDSSTLSDADVCQAANALAQTYETASRGIVYEHVATGTSAKRLAADIRSMISTKQAEGFQLPDHDVAVAFRRLEAAARDARNAVGAEHENSRAYLQLLKRVLKDPGTFSITPGDKGNNETRTESGLILPGR